jgi:hypothetical protein
VWGLQTCATRPGFLATFLYLYNGDNRSIFLTRVFWGLENKKEIMYIKYLGKCATQMYAQEQVFNKILDISITVL